MFKIGILIGDHDDVPPEKLAPGYDFAEIPVSILLTPTQSSSVWQENKARISSWHLPPITTAAYFLEGGRTTPVTGPHVDWEHLEFWTKRAFVRMAELGIKVPGVYGGFFPVPEGFSRAEATDQALRFCSLLADEAKKHGMVVALEPMADPHTLWPRYLDGIAFARELGRPEVKTMADLAYFLKLGQPLEDIAKYPEYCVHCHIAGEGGQPGLGDRVAVHRRLFEILKDIGYEMGVSAASPWVGEFAVESAKTLAYLQNLRADVYRS